MKKHHISLTLTTLCFAFFCQLSAQSLQSSSSPYLDAIFSNYMDNNNMPGLAACIVKDGHIGWVGIYGDAIIESNVQVDTTTLFMLASVSKTIVVTRLMQLWEEGLFDLDDDINDYGLPFRVRNPYDTLAPITFRMLCTHTSSIRDNWNEMPVYWTGDSPIPLEEYLFDYLDPDGENYNGIMNYYYNVLPGTEYNYSNIGVTLLGYLIELIGDSTFTYQTQEGIFEPLQMDETAWFLSELDTNNIAMPYTWNGSDYTPRGYYGFSYYPAGSLRSSINQLANFLISYTNDGMFQGQQILESSTIEMIRTPQIPEIDPGVGLIWFNGSIAGRDLWGHTGGFHGVATVISHCPEENTGFIILTNGEDINAASMSDLLYDYAADSIVISSVPPNLSNSSADFLSIFPNPVSEKTTLKYTLEKPGAITLKIVNIKGIDVKVLLDNHQSAGEYKIKFITLDLAPGVYFCVLKSNEGIQTIKLIKL